MSALTQFRDHARKMAAFHRDLIPQTGGNCWRGAHEMCLLGHDTCPCECHEPYRTPVPSDAERTLWLRLADEIDEYLARPALVVDLFGEAAVEPEDEPA